jgi:uroporphyrinogen III methyltransferase / synthase
VTAQNAADHGIRVDFVAKGGNGESLVKELGVSLSGRKVFLPRSDRGDRRLGDALRRAGALVTEVVAYSTVAPEPLDPELLEQIRRAGVDVITFTSPSSFRNLSDWIDLATLARLSSRVRFAAIGPTTAKCIRKAGSQIEIEAVEPSVQGLTDAIVKYYQRQESVGRPTPK